MNSTIELPAAVVERLQVEARRSRKSIGALVAEMLEDFADAKAADAAYRKHVRSGTKAVPLAAAKKQLDLAN